MQAPLIEYVRNRKGQLVGVVVAQKIKPDSPFYGIGWSKCHVGMDTFNKDMGLTIARVRSQEIAWEPNIPSDIKVVYDRMKNRAQKYFKNARNIQDSAMLFRSV